MERRQAGLVEIADDKAAGRWARLDRFDRLLDRFCTAYGGYLPLAFVGLIYLVNLGLSLASGRAPGYDDAEQLRDATGWAWGYSGVQPPLHTWIVMAVGSVVSHDLAAVYGTRFLVLFLTIAGLFGLGRALKLPPSGIAAAAMGACLLPQIGWEAQRAYSHSLTAMLFIVLLQLALARGTERPSLLTHLVIGAAAALAVLGKYNSLIVIAAIGVAAIAVADVRRSLDPRKLVAAALLALALLALPGAWLLDNMHRLDDSADKFAFSSFQSFWLDRLVGLGDLAFTMLTYIGPLLVVGAISLAISRKREGQPVVWVNPPDPTHRFLRLTMVVALGISIGLILLSGATQVKVYWLHPILITMPPVVAAILAHSDSTGRANRTIVAAAAVVLLVSVGVFVARVFV